MIRRRRKDPRYEHWRRRIFGLTWLSYVGLYLTRKAFPVVKNELKKPEVLGLTNAHLAWMDAANSAAYALGQFVWGPLGDRAGTRAVILVGMLGSVCAALFMGWTSSVVVLAVLLAFQGWFQASGWAPLSKNMSEFFSAEERGSVMGFWCTNYAFGGFIGSAIAGAVAQAWGWRWAFFVPAALLLGIWILFYLFQKDTPEDAGLPPIEVYHGLAREPKHPGRHAKPGESWGVVREVLRNRMVWLLAGVYVLIKPTRYLVLFWSPVFIHEQLGTGTAASGILGSVFEIAGPLGALAGGLLSDRVFGARRMPASILALFLLGAFMMVFRHLPATPLAVGSGLFLIGFLIYIPDSLVSGTAAIDFGTKRGASTASGLVNGCGSLGQIVGVSMPGWISKVTGNTADIWGPIFTSLGVALLVAGVLLLPQWNRRPPELKGA